MKPEWSALHAKLVSLETAARYCYQQIAEFDSVADGETVDLLDKALEQVNTALDAAVERPQISAVKSLVWDDHSKMNADGEYDSEGTDLRAVTTIGTYYISFDHFHRVPFELNPPHGGNNEHFDRIEAAKARAEELHQTAVKGCIE